MRGARLPTAPATPNRVSAGPAREAALVWGLVGEPGGKGTTPGDPRFHGVCLGDPSVQGTRRGCPWPAEAPGLRGPGWAQLCTRHRAGGQAPGEAAPRVRPRGPRARPPPGQASLPWGLAPRPLCFPSLLPVPLGCGHPALLGLLRPLVRCDTRPWRLLGSSPALLQSWGWGSPPEPGPRAGGLPVLSCREGPVRAAGSVLLSGRGLHRSLVFFSPIFI